MGSSDCVFCKMVAGEIPTNKIYEDQTVLAFLDIAPVSDGHTLVIPKKHFEKVHECPEEILADLGRSLGKISNAVSQAMESEGYNILCNNGRAAGQLVNHLHYHVICRNPGDKVFNHWPAYEYPAGKISRLAKKIKEKL